MPWHEVSLMDQRLEFVRLAAREGVNRRELCRRFGISARTGYKWLARHATGASLADRSRRPHASPRRCEDAIEAAILRERERHPAWGARKIRRVLERAGWCVPSSATVHAVLHRHGCVAAPRGGSRACIRFERAAPNELWQMDFKGWFTLGDGSRCHALTAIDDHARYALCLQALERQTFEAVKAALEAVFARYGLPDALFVDNGPPWGDTGGARWTRLKVWLARLGVAVLHARPYHPQSRGKNERFHRTLDDEVLALRVLRDRAQAQAAFDAFRSTYNLERPHEALGFEVPASRYRPSHRSMPKTLPQPAYAKDTILRRVSSTKAYVSFKGRLWKVPEAFMGETLAIRPLNPSGTYAICFATNHIATIDLTKPKTVNHVSEQVSAMSLG